MIEGYMRLLLSALAVLAALTFACGLEAPGAVVEDPGCTKDSDCKASRICVIPFGHEAGSCQNPEVPGAGGDGGTPGGAGSGGRGGTGGTGGMGGTGGTSSSPCQKACEILLTCLPGGVSFDQCVQICSSFSARCRECVVAACDAGQADPLGACAASCIPPP